MTAKRKMPPAAPAPPSQPAAKGAPKPPRRKDAAAGKTREIGGPKGPEPTRYGDWERKGRCVDF